MTPLAITTDYVADHGDAAPYLRRIAAAGFSHVHWCHEWNTDFEYAPAAVAQIGRQLAECELKLLDLHGSAGQTRRWFAPVEAERLAGVALVRNRLAMTARLGGQTVIMHAHPAFLDPLRRSLDALQPVARQHGVRIAIENTPELATPRQLLCEYPPEFLGLCYDSGHGNLADRRGLDELATVTGRLIAVHLHDNNGTADQHHLPFTGTVDWPRLTRLIAQSSYRQCVSLEVVLRPPEHIAEVEFLARAVAAGQRLASLIVAAGFDTAGDSR